MTESAYSINERASTTLGLTLSHPVIAVERDRENKILPQHLVPANPPSRYRRYPEYRKVSSDGGFKQLAPMVGNAPRFTRRAEKRSNVVSVRINQRCRKPKATFRANLSGRFPSVRGCFDGGYGMGDIPGGGSIPHYNSGRRAWFESMRPTFKAPSGRCFRTNIKSWSNRGRRLPRNVTGSQGLATVGKDRDIHSSQFDRKTDCFDGGVGRLTSPIASALVSSRNVRPVLNAGYSGATFKVVCGTQTRMPEGFNLMCNQNQALTTPVNLVGGSLMTEPYLPLVGSSHPTKGEAMDKYRRA